MDCSKHLTKFFIHAYPAYSWLLLLWLDDRGKLILSYIDTSLTYKHLYNKYEMMATTWLASLNQLMDRLPQTQVEAKTPLVNQGETATTMFFVRKGCIRACFNNDGNLITTQFFVEGQVATAFESFMTQTPSQFSLESIEPSHLSLLTKQDFDHLSTVDRSFHDWFYQTAVQKLIEHTNRLLSFIKDSPQKRYAQLVELQPELLSRFSQHYIASYLGITPVSLSRIKNRKRVAS